MIKMKVILLLILSLILISSIFKTDDVLEGMTSHVSPCGKKEICPKGCTLPVELSGNCREYTNIKTTDGSSYKICPYECKNPLDDCEYDQCCYNCGATVFKVDESGNVINRSEITRPNNITGNDMDSQIKLAKYFNEELEKEIEKMNNGSNIPSGQSSGQSSGQPSGQSSGPSEKPHSSNIRRQHDLNKKSQAHNAIMKMKSHIESNGTSILPKIDLLENASPTIINNFYYFDEEEKHHFPRPGQATHIPTSSAQNHSINKQMTNLIDAYYSNTNTNNNSNFTRNNSCEDSVTGMFTECGPKAANLPCYKSVID